eukprot:c14359_g2_i1.p1 GENE.c14359_g2_i1~~c14359_g2_i1.p1  ORF type:complete len:552 (+),score=189.30 c14359_g2_i1:75-1658(+)
MDVDNLQSLSDDEVVQQLKVFNTQNAYKVEFAPIIGEENKRKIVDALVERIIRDGLSVEVYTCCMETLRILCREKASMDSLYRPEMIARIISLLNRDVADNATNESIKLLVNTIISSSESRKIMLDNQIFDVVRKTLLNEKVSIQARGFCCRLLLHLTAPSDDESLKYSQNFEHQESLTVVLRSAIEALDQEHGKFTCNESFKILYHVTRLLSKEFEKEVDTPKTEATTQVATTNGTKVETETTKEDVSTTTTTITTTRSFSAPTHFSEIKETMTMWGMKCESFYKKYYVPEDVLRELCHVVLRRMPNARVAFYDYESFMHRILIESKDFAGLTVKERRGKMLKLMGEAIGKGEVPSIWDFFDFDVRCLTPEEVTAEEKQIFKEKEIKTAPVLNEGKESITDRVEAVKKKANKNQSPEAQYKAAMEELFIAYGPADGKLTENDFVNFDRWTFIGTGDEWNDYAEYASKEIFRKAAVGKSSIDFNDFLNSYNKRFELSNISDLRLRSYFVTILVEDAIQGKKRDKPTQ